ncbi:MAG: NADH-quinone oxidoreductase subunit NuoF [Candidatus Omnitrophica bacterium]|nr:NADH-quinone oxidoreductase subunit NuoF [Candidatus Omnitrophota bacterium]
MSLIDLQPQAKEILAQYEQPRAATLPLLRLCQEQQGYVTPEAEEWVAGLVGTTPAHIHEVVTFYTQFNRQPVGKYHLQLCTNISCVLAGADACLKALTEKLGIQPGHTTPDGKFTLSTVECLCACEAAPMLQINEDHVGPIGPEVLDTVLAIPDTVRLRLAPMAPAGKPPFLLTRRFNTEHSQKIETYVRDDGYQAARKVVTSMKPEEVIAEVAKSNLRGLGGAGFPTGKKWSFIPKPSSKPKYLVVNADEGEPGTFKDRFLLERDPHAVIEGMLIAAYAIGSHKAYIYIRGEYGRPCRIFAEAVAEARKYGFVGKKIFGSDYNVEIVIHRGAGAYICGEETALLSSLEGGKGFPRLKPPFPAIAGLFGCPTIVNNVETLAHVPTIITKGAEWFAKLGGTPRSGGTRLFSVSGHVRFPGIYEAPHSITLRELIASAGGVRKGHELKAVIPGGMSAKILTANEIDVQMDFDALLAAGTMAGSAGVVVMDETVCMVRALHVATKFFSHESCGQCSPCREGTGWVHKIVTRILHGEGRPQDLDHLVGIATNMEGRTICVFADAAAWPVQSYVGKFKSEFEYHIREKRCEIAAEPAYAEAHH